MRWFPPWSLTRRTKWAEEHPWIAGFYLGFVLAVVMTVWGQFRTRASLLFGIAVAVPTWLAAWVLFPLLAKRHFGERPNRDNYPRPTLRRYWSRTSDRFVFWGMVVGIGAVLVSASDLIANPHNLLDNVVGIIVGGFVAVTTWAERRTRRRST